MMKLPAVQVLSLTLALTLLVAPMAAKSQLAFFGFVVTYKIENRQDVFALQNGKFTRISHQMRLTTDVSRLGDNNGPEETIVDVNESASGPVKPLDYFLVPAPNDTLIAKITRPDGEVFEAEMAQDSSNNIRYTDRGIRDLVNNEDRIAKQAAVQLLMGLIKRPENANLAAVTFVPNEIVDDTRKSPSHFEQVSVENQNLVIRYDGYTIKVKGMGQYH